MHLFQQPVLPLIPLFLEPEVPCSLIRRYLLGAFYGVIGCPGRSGRHHVIVVAEREPSSLLIGNQTGKVNTIIVAGYLDLFLLSLTFVPIEIMRPSTGNASQ